MSATRTSPTRRRPPVPASAATTLPAERQSPHRARRFVADHLEDWGCAHATEVTTLLVSELVTNGVTHAATPVGLAVGCDGSVVAVAVTDGMPDGVDATVSPQPWRRAAPSGRGLQIVDALALRWGVAVHDTGKTVWFEVPVEPSDA